MNRRIVRYVVLIGIAVSVYYIGTALYRKYQRSLASFVDAHRSWPTKDLLDGEPFHDDFDGIDISEYQGNIHWDMVGDGEREPKFIYVRAIGKRGRLDKEYDRMAQNIHEMKIPMGSYIFFHNETSVEHQYEQFCKMLDSAPQELIPMIDIEERSIRRSKANLKENVKKLADMLEEKYDTKPIIYSNEKFYEDYLAPDFNDYPLWIANYTGRPEIEDAEPIIWQYSEKGHVKGFWTTVDLDMFINGSGLSDLEL